MANFPTVSAPVAAPAATPAPAAPTPAGPPPASVLMGLRAAPEAEAATGPRMPDTTVDPFIEPEEQAEAADNPAPGALDANPGRTAAALHAHLSAVGVDPTLATFYQGRVEKALAAPAPTAEQLAIGCTDARQALVDQYGDDADAIGELARQEVQLLARDHPQIIGILERTGLGNDVHLLKALASRGYNRWLTSRGYGGQ